jgi:hypothetical protein
VGKAFAFEKRFSGRVHVGAVTHFDGWDVPRAGALVATTLRALGLAAETVMDVEEGLPVFHAAAPLAVGDGMELWVVLNEKPQVGCILQMRVFHALEDAALADEYLAGLASRLALPRGI